MNRAEAAIRRIEAGNDCLGAVILAAFDGASNRARQQLGELPSPRPRAPARVVPE